MKKRTRKNARTACEVRGTLFGRHGNVSGTVQNLSTGGLYFVAKDISVERQTEMSFELEGEEIRAVVEVLYQMPRGTTGGVGVRFLRLGAGAVDHISRYLAAVEPPPP